MCRGYVVDPSDAGSLSSIVDARPTGTTFCFKPGLYRLTEPIAPKLNDRFIGTGGTRNDVELTGAKQITSWTSSGGMYVHTGDAVSLEHGGMCFLTSTHCEFPDWLFKNDAMMARVLSPCTTSNVVAGKFCVDYGARKIYIRDDPTGKNLEYSRVPGALVGLPEGTGATIRNLTISKFANAAQSKQVVLARDDWVLDNVRITGNHACGVSIIGISGAVVRNSRLDNNGQEGFCGSGSVGAIFTSNEVDHNNLLNFQTEGGGGKFMQTVALTVSRNNFHDNKGSGLWIDVDNTGTTVTRNTSTNNLKAGLTTGNGDGIQVEASCFVTLTGNTVSGNAAGGITVFNSHHVTVGAAAAPNIVKAPAQGNWGIRILATGRTGTAPHCGSMGNATDNHIVANHVYLSTGGAYNGVIRQGGSVARTSFSGNRYHLPSGGCSSQRWKWWDGSHSSSVKFSGSGTTWRGTYGQDRDGSCGS
jgi:parallel beta-helix repeat protein